MTNVVEHTPFKLKRMAPGARSTEGSIRRPGAMVELGRQLPRYTFEHPNRPGRSNRIADEKLANVG